MERATRTDGTDSSRTAAREITGSRDFRALVQRRWIVTAILLGLLFASYYGFILLVASAPGFVGRKIGAATTLAIPLGLAPILVAWLLTAVHVAWANRRYDTEVGRLKSQFRR